MFQHDLNFYSLLIPIMIIGFGSIVLIFHCFHALPRYLRTYALAMICLGISIFLHSVLIEPVLLACMTCIICIYFLSCALHIYAIHQRLMIEMRWGRILCLVVVGLTGIFYFSILDDHQIIRLMIIGLITACIYLHHISALLQKKNLVGLDYWIHILLWSIVVLALSRAIGLTLVLNNQLMISSHDPIWAMTQLMLLLIDTVFLGVFIGCATLDLLKKLRDERNLDALTGCLNRRGLDDHLQDVAKQPLQLHAILLCDLDYFKKINDEHGHYVGDLALQHFSHLARKVLSRSDEIIRVGGEEFLLLLHDTEHEIALDLAVQLQHLLKQSPLIYQGQAIVFSISIGISYFHFREDFDDAFNEADQFLYRAKKAGRNQIKVQQSLSVADAL